MCDLHEAGDKGMDTERSIKNQVITFKESATMTRD